MKSRNRYPHDFTFRIIAAVVGAYIVTQYGDDLPLLELLLTKVFYIEFGATLLITLLVVQVIYMSTVLLDRRFDWHQKPLQRVALQAILGIVLPTLLTFLLATLYFVITASTFWRRITTFTLCPLSLHSFPFLTSITMSATSGPRVHTITIRSHNFSIPLQDPEHQFQQWRGRATRQNRARLHCPDADQ